MKLPRTFLTTNFSTRRFRNYEAWQTREKGQIGSRLSPSSMFMDFTEPGCAQKGSRAGLIGRAPTKGFIGESFIFFPVLFSGILEPNRDQMGPYRPQMNPYWAHIGPKWAHMGPHGPIWALMGPYGPIWAHMGPYGAHMGPPGQVRT